MQNSASKYTALSSDGDLDLDEPDTYLGTELEDGEYVPGIYDLDGDELDELNFNAPDDSLFNDLPPLVESEDDWIAEEFNKSILGG